MAGLSFEAVRKDASSLECTTGEYGLVILVYIFETRPTSLSVIICIDSLALS
jgi:hypothetical protein